MVLRVSGQVEMFRYSHVVVVSYVKTMRCEAIMKVLCGFTDILLAAQSALNAIYNVSTFTIKCSCNLMCVAGSVALYLAGLGCSSCETGTRGGRPPLSFNRRGDTHTHTHPVSANDVILSRSDLKKHSLVCEILSIAKFAEATPSYNLITCLYPAPIAHFSANLLSLKFRV